MQIEHQKPPEADRIESDISSQKIPTQVTTAEKIICNHCLRTATNGIKCKGICVADSDY